MKRIILLIFSVFVLGSCSTTSSFSTPKDEDASLVYCAFRFVDGQTTVSGITVRNADNLKASPIHLKRIGNNVFVHDRMKPGKYYIETMELSLPYTFVLSKSRLYLGSPVNHDWDFQVFGKTIMNIGTRECEARRKPFIGSSVTLFMGPHRDDIDIEALKLLMENAAGTYWEAPLGKYFEKRYGEKSRNSAVL